MAAANTGSKFFLLGGGGGSSTPLVFADGTAANPFHPTSDAHTGFYYSSANVLGFSANSTASLLFGESGTITNPLAASFISLGGIGGSITITAGGSNQNILLTPSGSGIVTLGGSSPTIRAVTNTTLTLATLDNNKNITLTPHGTGKVVLGGSNTISAPAGDITIEALDTFKIIYLNAGLGGAIRVNGLTQPQSDGGAPLGAVGLAWSDLFLTGALNTGAPTAGTAKPWKLGNIITAGTSVFSTTKYVEVDIDGALVKLGVVTNS